MKRIGYAVLLIASVMGCKKPYSPPVVANAGNYLVVEGIINPGPDSTIIKLSRTVNVSSKVTVNPILGAKVAVLNDQNTTFPLTETGKGNYVSSGLNLDNTRQYRINIKTADGKVYQSDLESVNIIPPIDSIGFNLITAPDTGIEIYANTHDQTNTVHYFRWDYNENWEFRSRWISNYIANGLIVVKRTPSQYLSDCYSNDVSSDIVLGSSAKLSQDVLYQNPLVFIRYNSEKIEARYSILLRQYALTADAYNFWQSLKKNTEQLGSIFDAQPSELTGNIHCISQPSEQVIGYISVSTISTKRGFIYDSQLPAWVPAYPYSCNLGKATLGEPDYNYLIQFPDLYLATDTLIIPNTSPMPAYYWTSRECADCTIKEAKIPPLFWRRNKLS